MSIESKDGDRAVTDAELVQYLDGELGRRTTASVVRRVAATPDAADRLEVLRHRSERLSRLLADTEPHEAWMQESAAGIRAAMARADRAQARSFRLPWDARAAAGVALLVGAAAIAAPGVRAWVVDQVREVAAVMGLGAPAGPALAPTAPTAPMDAPGADIGVTFAVTGDAFEVHVPGAAGVLILRAGDAGTGTAEAEGAPATGFVVLPEALRLEGPGAPGAVYTVTLPGTVASVGVVIGDGPVQVHRLPERPDVLRIPLR